MHYIFLMLILVIPSVDAQIVKLDCKTKKTFDGEDYGVKGDPKTDTRQAFEVNIDMRYVKADMQERDYRNLVLGPTIIVMEHTEGPGSDGKTRTNTTEINRETLAVKTALALDNRPFKEWKGSCRLLSKQS